MDITGIQNVVDFQKDLTNQNSKVTSSDFSDTLKKAMEEDNLKELKEGCKEIESYMLSYVFKKMKESMLTDEGITEKGDYERMFEDNMIQTMCDNVVKAGGIGLADSMYKQMLNTYQAQNNLSADESKTTTKINQEI